ncbi:MAG: hypothetical protein H6710_14605 [Myxococcales bacterium]|nr:hypothetical protein [Myxococcales bacterium]MCB9702094.1 hypothetical protein [Myxococcales bacterium]
MLATAAKKGALVYLSLAACLAGGCPDPDARLDAFLEASEEERNVPPPKEDLGSTLADINGDFLLALSSVIDPDHPLQFYCTAMLVQNPDGTGTLSLNFQPLSLDPQSTTTPRQPVGDALLFEDIQVSAEGAFTLDLGAVAVTGMANPITGSDIEANLSLSAFIQDENLFCGNVEGAVTMPLMADLSGSTFAATRVTGVDALPETFAVACPP